jgi:hypothetical protein
VSGETIRTPAAGAVFWAEAMPDGSAGVRAIAGAAPAFQVTLTAPLPAGISAASDSRGLVLQAGPMFFAGQASEAQLSTPPTLPAITVTGTAQARDGRFHPRRFSVTPGRAAPSYVAFRPSLQATDITEAGALIAHLQWQGAGAASWSVVTLACTRNGTALGFSGQADVHGDVIVPFTGLPPLPASQTSDSMTMTVRGDPTQSGQAIGDPDALKAVRLATSGTFAAQQTLTIVRGQIATAASLGVSGFTLQAA